MSDYKNRFDKALLDRIEYKEIDPFARIEFLEKALTEIKDFGKKNAGFGFTCSKMAEKALEK